MNIQTVQKYNACILRFHHKASTEVIIVYYFIDKCAKNQLNTSTSTACVAPQRATVWRTGRRRSTKQSRPLVLMKHFN